MEVSNALNTASSLLDLQSVDHGRRRPRMSGRITVAPISNSRSPEQGVCGYLARLLGKAAAAEGTKDDHKNKPHLARAPFTFSDLSEWITLPPGFEYDRWTIAGFVHDAQGALCCADHGGARFETGAMSAMNASSPLGTAPALFADLGTIGFVSQKCVGRSAFVHSAGRSMKLQIPMEAAPALGPAKNLGK
jgi:hypothetical protein